MRKLRAIRDNSKLGCDCMFSIRRFSFTRRLGPAAAVVVVAAAFALTAPDPGFSQSAIRILVNDKPITSYDIQQRARMMRVFSGGRQGEKEAIEQLIDERLMLEEAGRRGAVPDDAEVQTEFVRRAASAKLSAAQFEQAMRQAGFDPRTFRDFLKATLSWQQIVRARFRATVSVSEQDVAAALSGHDAPDAANQTYEYRLQQILFLVPSGGGAGAEAKSRSLANAYRSAFQSCDQSLQQAGGAPGIVVKPQFRREEGQMADALKNSLAPLGVGGVTEPERVAEGFQIVAVCAKNEIAGQTEAAVEAREELSNERGALLARRYLRDLRSDAVIEYR